MTASVRSAAAPVRIPFNRASFTGDELHYISQAIDNGWIAGDGPFTKKCEALLEEMTGAPHALLTTSCTHALEMAALLLDLQAGDEVIAPSFTFVSTVNAFALRGARPIFADIRPDTLNIDETQLPRLLTPRVKALAVVHYAGVACEMDAIMEFARAHGLAVVEDNAHGLLGEYRGRPLGTFGALAALSFHETKNFTCGEGGALLINDASFHERAEIIREKGTDRSRFFRGQIDKYTWVDIGSSYLPSDLNAAFLYAQLQNRESIQTRRERIWREYSTRLADWAARCGVRLPAPPAHCRHPSHLFYLLLPSPAARDGLLAHLRARGILGVFHYLPLHLSAMGRRYGGREGDCPVAERVAATLLRLPFFNSLSPDEQDVVMAAVLAFTP
jgi:dTDP-4-amino-4,6-dideoxygalactose transaminase